MPLKLSYTDEAASQKSTVLLYGDNGSGKTTFASTWPNPVFLVPALSMNEMKSLVKHKFPIVSFDSLKELKEQVNELGKAILKGDIRCDTIVVDNLTAIQMALEEELKRTGRRDKLEWDDWGKFLSVFKNLLESLHKLPPHIVWITHQRIIKVDDTNSVGAFTLVGKSRELIPGFSDMILHATVTDLHGAGLKYRVHLKGHEIWTGRIRGDKEKVMQFPAYIEDPCYDALAVLMGWPSCAEVENTPAPEVDKAAVAAAEDAPKR